jgi:hypothetical protein
LIAYTKFSVSQILLNADVHDLSPTYIVHDISSFLGRNLPEAKSNERHLMARGQFEG